jgi:hypothetical protein
MEWPLAAAPRLALVDGAPLVVKDATPLDRFHLNSRTGDPPIFCCDFHLIHLEIIQHVFYILFIQGHGGLALATVTAPFAFKYIRLMHHNFTSI